MKLAIFLAFALTAVPALAQRQVRQLKTREEIQLEQQQLAEERRQAVQRQLDQSRARGEAITPGEANRRATAEYLRERDAAARARSQDTRDRLHAQQAVDAQKREEQRAIYQQQALENQKHDAERKAAKAADDEQREKERVAAIGVLAREKKVADQPIKKLALRDGAKAAKHGVGSMFGVRIGAPLNIPNCDDNESGAIKSTGIFGVQYESPKSCYYLNTGDNSKGETLIHWGSSQTPAWADAITVDIRDDVIVALHVGIASGVVSSGGSTFIGTGLAGGVAAGMAAAAQQAAQINMAARVRSSQKDSSKQLIAKFGAPDKVESVEYTDGTKRNRPIWNHVPGLHVNYELGPYADRLSIEVDSVAEEREKSEQKAEEAAPKL
jgi:hypothetical protein